MAQKPRRARGPNQGKPPHGPSPQTGRRQELDVSPTDPRASPQGNTQPRGDKHQKKHDKRPGYALGEPLRDLLARPADQKPRERDGHDAAVWDDAPRKVTQGRDGKRRTQKGRRPTPNQLHESLPPTVTRTPCRPAAAARWKKATRRQKTVPRGPDAQNRRIRPPLQAGTGRLRHKSLHGWRQGRRAPRHSREEAVRGAARNPSALRKHKAMPQTAGIPRRAEARTASPLAKYAEGDLFNMCDLEL